MTEDDELERLREQTEGGDRIEEEASRASFGGIVKEELDAVHDGEKSDTIAAYDRTISAVVHALAETEDGLQEDVEELQRRLGKTVDGEDAKRSDLLRLAVRFALREVDRERYEDATEAVSEWQDPGL